MLVSVLPEEESLPQGRACFWLVHHYTPDATLTRNKQLALHMFTQGVQFSWSEPTHQLRSFLMEMFLGLFS